ncbi:MAG: hypothetical protein HEQ32_01605 [Vampirovibrio sp.]
MSHHKTVQRLVAETFKSLKAWQKAPNLDPSSIQRYVTSESVLKVLVQQHKGDFYEAVAKHNAIQEERMLSSFGGNRLTRLINATLSMPSITMDNAVEMVMTALKSTAVV